MASKPRNKTPKPAALRIEGEFTIFRAAELMPALVACPPPAEIDLSGVTEIDSAGVQLLLLAARQARDDQRALRLVARSAAVDEVFRLLNLGPPFADILPGAPRDGPAASPIARR
jgi:anti-anti-sigma factor